MDNDPSTYPEGTFCKVGFFLQLRADHQVQFVTTAGRWRPTWLLCPPLSGFAPQLYHHEPSHP